MLASSGDVGDAADEYQRAYFRLQKRMNLATYGRPRCNQIFNGSSPLQSIITCFLAELQHLSAIIVGNFKNFTQIADTLDGQKGSTRTAKGAKEPKVAPKEAKGTLKTPKRNQTENIYIYIRHHACTEA